MDSITASIIAGLLQGLLEWLPVSSEGNMVILLTQLFSYGAEESLNTSIFLKRKLPKCSHQGDEVSIAKAVVFEAHPRDSASFPPFAPSTVFRSHSGKLY